MSRARHKAMGGGVKKTVYAGEGSNVLREAEERKRGGKVMHGEGEMPKARADKRARGGPVGRKRGGGVGANLTPLSTAARVKELPGQTPEKGVPSD